MWGSDLCSSGEARKHEFPTDCGPTTLWVEFSARLCLICSYLCWFGVFGLGLRRSLSAIVLWFLSEEIFLYVAVHLVCLWEEVRSGSSYFTIFNQNFYCGVLMVVFCFSHSFHICYLKFILRKNSSPYMLVWGQWYLLFEYTPILLLFCCSNYSSAGISFTVVSWNPFDIFLFLKSIYLFSGTIRCFYFPSLRLKIGHFSRNPWLFLLDNDSDKLTS